MYKQIWRSPVWKLIVLAVVLNLYIELLNQKGVSGCIGFIRRDLAVFGINTLIILASLIPGVLFRRRLFYCTLLSLLWAVGGTINGAVLAYRITPFTTYDLDLLKTGLGVLPNYFTTWQIYAMGFGILAIFAILIIVFVKGPKAPSQNLLIGGVIVATCWISLAFGVQTGLKTDKLSAVFNNLGHAYEHYGFAYCFCNTWLNRGVTMPPNYTQERMEGILAKLQEDKEWTEETPAELPNIIFVQLESFMDPQYIKWMEYSEDPLPNWRHIKRRGSDGFLTVPVVGAGTANTEFEVMTGMRIRFFGPGEYPFETVLKDKTTESIAYNLKEAGYTTHAIHNHRGVFYGRNQIYKNLGYDDFTSLEYMLHVTKTPKNWARDQVLTEEIMAALQASEGRDYIYTVSVQGHGKYPTKQVYTDPVITVSGLEDQERLYQFEYYVNQLYEMDQFIGELTDALSAYEEPTVVVFYGDHLPNLGISESELTNHNLFQTEYVVWSNFRMKQKDQDLYAWQLSAEILKQLNIHVGTITQFHQTQAEKTSYISNLKALQYDMLYGKQYVYGGESPFVPSDMKMGVRQIRATDVFCTGDRWYVRGENFTPYSKITVDGAVIETEYISETLLEAIDVKELPQASQIQISQVEKYGEVLSVSPETLPEE